MYPTIEQVLQEVFYIDPPRYYVCRTESNQKARVEAGSNTYTVSLLVVGGDENGTQCLGV
jgi:hypothetical protein